MAEAINEIFAAITSVSYCSVSFVPHLRNRYVLIWNQRGFLIKKTFNLHQLFMSSWTHWSEAHFKVDSSFKFFEFSVWNSFDVTCICKDCNISFLLYFTNVAINTHNGNKLCCSWLCLSERQNVCLLYCCSYGLKICSSSFQKFQNRHLQEQKQ